MRSKVKSGVMWRSLESVSVQGMQFFIQLLLARLLLPEDFGVIAIMNIFVNFANTLVNNGLSSAILQRKNPDKVDFSTVFYLENIIASITYLIIFFSAPLVSSFYDNPDLTLYLRVFAISIVISSLGGMQNIKMVSQMEFKPSFVANFAAIICQGIVGVLAAYSGFGVWSLIISQIVFCIVRTVLLFVYARYIPALLFSFQRLKELFGFSWKLTVGWIIGTLYHDLFSLIIGKVYNERILGFYSRGNTIPFVVNRVVTQVTTAVMFPAIAKNQDDLDVVKVQTRNMLSLSASLMFPIMAVIAGISSSLVYIVLTEKWMPVVPIIQIFCIPAALSVISNANMQTFNALGRSDVFLRLEMIKRTITILLVLILSKIDFTLMLCGIAMMSLVDVCINCHFNIKLFGYGIKEQMADLVPTTIWSILLFVVVYALNYVIDDYYIRLLIQLSVAGVLYFVLLFSGVSLHFKKLRETLLSFIKR